MSKDCGDNSQLNSWSPHKKMVPVRSQSTPLLEVSANALKYYLSMNPPESPEEMSPEMRNTQSPCNPFSHQDQVCDLNSSIEQERLITDNQEYIHKLPTLTHTSHSEFKCIDPQTLVDVMNNSDEYGFERVVIIDCRFDFEYSNGHIKNADNFPNADKMTSLFMSNPEYLSLREKICLVFHCEYSSHRAPIAYRSLRKLDRNANVWPNLYYPEMYLLDGGYKKFYHEKLDFCVGSYVEMRDPKYAAQLKQAAPRLGKLKTKSRYLSRSCQNIMMDTSLPTRQPSFSNLFPQQQNTSNQPTPYR